MSILSQQLCGVVRKYSSFNNLSNLFRTLSVTPRVLYKDSSELKISNLPSLSTSEEQKTCNTIFEKVNKHIAENKMGRLFAVVHLCGKQFKVTAGDIILVEGYWPPTIGDEIQLEKVLLAGGRNFTLIGRPMLNPELVNVKATIIEKTLSHTKTHFKKKRRKQFMRINFQRSPNTMIRINSIEIEKNANTAFTNINEKKMF